MAKKRTHEWLRDRINHFSLTKKQRETIDKIADEHLTYTEQRDAIRGDILDTPFITIGVKLNKEFIPVQHTRVARKRAEPKYKSTSQWDTPVIITPEKCTEDTLVITEGFSKAAAVSLLGYEALALPGVTMFKDRIRDFVLTGVWSKILVIFDSSTEQNEDVEAAKQYIVNTLSTAGLRVYPINWEAGTDKGLDDVLKNQGINVLKSILNQDLDDCLSPSEISGDPCYDVAKSMVEDFNPWLVEDTYRIKDHENDLTVDGLLNLFYIRSKAFKYFDKKKGSVVPTISSARQGMFKADVKALLSQCPTYDALLDGVHFESDEIEHYQTKVDYDPAKNPLVLKIFLEYLNNSVENPDMFRALCRRVLVKPGKIEKDSLCFFTLLGASNTGKSTLLRILRSLVGESSSARVAASSLVSMETLGHHTWKKLMYDDDAGGKQLSPETIIYLLMIVEGTMKVRKLYQDAKTINFQGVLVINTTVPLKSERATGLARRNKAILTKNNPDFHAFCNLDRLTVASVVAAWALSMPEEEYIKMLDTNLVGGQSQSSIEEYLNATIDPHPTTATPIRSLYDGYNKLWSLKRMSIAAFEAEVISALKLRNLLVYTQQNEPALLGYSRTIGTPQNASDVVKGGNYLKLNAEPTRESK